MDAINAEDIADFPDANLAESLQRLPGIALDRDNGEGRSITVRGLGSDFTRVRLNGLETLSTAAASDSGAAPNRGRGFDFNVFASDLFSSLRGAQDRIGEHRRRLARRHRRSRDRQAARLQGHASSRFRPKTPITKTAARTIRASPAWSPTQFFDDTLRRFAVGRLQRARLGSRPLQAPGRASPTTRTAARPGTGNETAAARRLLPRPTGTHFRHRGHQRPNPRPSPRMTGSDPAAYAALYPGAPYSTPGRFNDSLVRIPVADQHRAAGSRAGAPRRSPAPSSGSRPRAPTSASTRCIRSSIRRAT